MMKAARICFCAGLIVLVALVIPPTIDASGSGGYAPSRFRVELDETEARLAEGGYEGRWKRLRRESSELIDDAVKDAWNSRDLEPVLAALSLYRGAAEANLGNTERGLWLWHTAINIDHRIARRDLSDLGAAAKLFREFPLRSRGEVPPGIQVLLPPYPETYEPPEEPHVKTKRMIESNSLVRERPGDFHVEIVLDEEGRMHQPVVTSVDPHPVYVYATLEWLADLRPLRPARADGEPRAVILPVIVDPNYPLVGRRSPPPDKM